MSQRQMPGPAEVYEHYLARAIADPWTRVLLELASPQSGEQVLDLACGTGSVARQAAPMVGVTGHVVAVDINPDMLETGRAQPAPAGAPIAWRQGDATRLELPDDAFDLVLCQQGLQFFPDRAASLREMRRVLRNEGRAVMSVWGSLDRHPVYEALFKATARHMGEGLAGLEIPFSLSDPRELESLLGDAGFRRIEISPGRWSFACLNRNALSSSQCWARLPRCRRSRGWTPGSAPLSRTKSRKRRTRCCSASGTGIRWPSRWKRISRWHANPSMAC